MGITPDQFRQMEKRVTGAARAEPVFTQKSQSFKTQQVVLGLDPSLRGTGYGIIRLANPFPETLVHGTIVCPAGWPHSRCLLQIAETLRETIRLHRPEVCAIEGIFFAQNLQTALTMGQARGAAMVAVAEAGLDIYEIAPRKVKQAIVGYGAAQKLAVAKMVQHMLRLAELPSPDAADALALALAHLQQSHRFALNLPRKL